MGSKPFDDSQLSCQKLPSEVINSIRSGITITSVSRCVEELVLNSVDARATNIEISVNLETFRVKVTDNGQGITKEDLLVVGERYRTSKCHSLKDLDINVNQYGFRGEALSSIITVSNGVEIRTSYGNSEVYSRKIRHGQESSRIIKISDHKGHCGCTVFVHGVLSTQPVRQNRIDKSLELEEIKKVLQVISLINFNVGITLRNDVTGALVFQSNPSRSIKEAYIEFTKPRHGINPHANVIEVDYSQDCIVLKGFVSTEGHGTRGFQLIYVNKRFVVRTKLFKLFNMGLLPILGLKGSSKSSQSQTQGSSRATTTTATSSSSSSSDKYPAFLINVICPGNEYDFICDEVKFRHMEIVTKGVDGFLNTFKILLSRQNRLEVGKNEQLLIEHPRLFAIPSKRRRRNETNDKALASIFKSNNNNNNNNNKTPNTTFKEYIGNQITVNDMKRAIQSKAAVRERIESTPQANNDDNDKILKSLNSSSSREKVNYNRSSSSNMNSQTSQRILPKSYSSYSLCSPLNRGGSSTVSTPDSTIITSQNSNYYRTPQFQCLIDQKSPLSTITSRVSKRKVPAQLDVIQRKRVNPNHTTNCAKQQRMAIQDVLDTVWMQRKTPQTTERIINDQIQMEIPIESPKVLNRSVENFRQPRNIYSNNNNNNNNNDGKRRQLGPSPATNNNLRNHIQQVEQNEEPDPFVPNNEIIDIDYHDIEEEKEISPNNFQFEELVNPNDSNKGIEDFKEQEEMNNIQTEEQDDIINNSYHNEEEGIANNSNYNEEEEMINNSFCIEEQEEIINNSYHDEGENIINNGVHNSFNAKKQELEVIDVCNNSMFLKNFTNYNKDHDPKVTEELHEHFHAMSEKLYNSHRKIFSRNDELKNSYILRPFYLCNRNKNTNGKMNLSSSDGDDVTLFGTSVQDSLNFPHSSRTLTNDIDVDKNVSPYFNLEIETVEKVNDTAPQTNTSRQNSIHVPNIIPEKFSILKDKNLNNKTPRHFERVNYFNLPNSNPGGLTSPTHKETLTQDSKEMNEEQEQDGEELEEEQILSGVFINNHDKNNIVDDDDDAGDIQVNFISPQNSIFQTSEHDDEEQLITDEEDEVEKESQEKKQELKSSPLIIVPYDIEAIPTDPSPPYNEDFDMNVDNDDKEDEEDHTLINIDDEDDDDLEQDEKDGDKFQSSPYFSCNNNNNINDNHISNNNQNTDGNKTPQQQQMDVIHDELSRILTSDIVQIKIPGSCRKEQEPQKQLLLQQEQQRDTVDNCLSRIIQPQPVANFRRAWLKKLMPDTAMVYGQKRQMAPYNLNRSLNNVNSVKRNNSYFEKIDRMGNLSLVENDNLLVGRAIRTVMSQNGDEMIMNKWRNYNMNNIRPSITSLVENYSSQNSYEDEWSISKAPLELPVINLNAQEVNLMCKQINSLKTSYRFSREDLSRVQVIGNIDCKFISAKVTIKQTFYSLAIAPAENETETMLVLFDQHAVHERILLEDYIANTFKENTDGVKVVSPIVLSVPMLMDFAESEVRILYVYAKQFEIIGIQVQILSAQTVKVLTVPGCFLNKVEKEAVCNQLNGVRKLTESLIQEQVQHIKQTNGTLAVYPKTVMDALKSLACRRAIKFGDPLTVQDSERLINQLKHCKVPFQCAHGRPVLVPLLSLNK